VTVRAVKQAAGVMSDVAAAAAREWNEAQAALVAVPDAPAAWTARLEALWPEAYRAARETFAAERAGLAAKVASAEAERDGTAADLDRAEAERDQARAEAARLAEAVEAARSAEQGMRDRMLAAERDHAEALRQAQTRAAAAEGLVAGLREALTRPSGRTDERPA
jgi:chromosome segregation ATPase